MKRLFLISLVMILSSGFPACSPEDKPRFGTQKPGDNENTEDPDSDPDPQDPVYYTKYVDMRNADMAAKLEMASHVIPSEAQLAWQRMELTAFVHISVNTFTGKEWGTGKESPDDFTPTALNTDHWVETLKNAGFRLVMLTAKHHDGFCLWPTATTGHSVKNSKWMDGKGDVVAMMRASCDKYGMGMGIYLSPWDRNAESYGKWDGSAYNDMFVAQLTELMDGSYGRIDEVWFDGANGSVEDNEYQTYAWERFLETVNRLQPQAVVANMGDDVRWVGNETGRARDGEWSVVAKGSSIDRLKNPSETIAALTAESEDLGSRAILTHARELFWYPAEVDVSIRPGWFYHSAEDDKVKTPEQLKEIYFQSVGRNAVLLLNVPPDKTGRLHVNDVRSLNAFGDWLRASFTTNLLQNGDRKWVAAEGEFGEYIVSGKQFNVIMLQEDISLGQRVDRFTVETSSGGGWTKIAEGTAIGHKRLLKLPSPISAQKMRVTITQTRANANIMNVGAFYCQ